AEVENAGNTPRLPDYDDCRRSQFVDEPPPAYTEVEEDDLLDFGDTIVPPLIPIAQSPPKPAKTPQNQAIHQMDRLRFWNPPMIGKLPPDFLKLTPQKSEDSPQETFHAGSQAQDTSNDDFLTDRELEQFLEDQKLALYLQNEEFIRQLRRDPDFISSLEEGMYQDFQSPLYGIQSQRWPLDN
ncbi:MAG: hypothetical protein GY786_19635, partial [Proteobacteria bacterium]|nr:hypothetical protein [Pseudomonadota bacterium]